MMGARGEASDRELDARLRLDGGLFSGDGVVRADNERLRFALVMLMRLRGWRIDSYFGENLLKSYPQPHRLLSTDSSTQHVAVIPLTTAVSRNNSVIHRQVNLV